MTLNADEAINTTKRMTVQYLAAIFSVVAAAKLKLFRIFVLFPEVGEPEFLDWNGTRFRSAMILQEAANNKVELTFDLANDWYLVTLELQCGIDWEALGRWFEVTGTLRHWSTTSLLDISRACNEQVEGILCLNI